MTRLLVLALTLVALLTAPAAAITPMQTLVAASIASEIWDHPCDDQVTVTAARLDSPTIGLGELGGCRVTITRGLSWRIYCTTMIHEFGHLAGQRHSRDRKSVMYPVLLHWHPACYHRDPEHWPLIRDNPRPAR